MLILTTLFWIPLEVGLLASFGTTPGKFFYNIKVLKTNGEKLSYLSALKRSLHVYIRGMGFGLPLINIFAMALAFDRVNKRRITPWDENEDIVIEHTQIGSGRIALLVLIFVIMLAMIIIERIT